MMVLRPYQYYATEAIINQVVSGNHNGYIWHTTGSGKTLTSFKASQIIMDLPQVHKVVFVVDRKDLDYQTMIEFNSFMHLREIHDDLTGLEASPAGGYACSYKIY
jgi:type I restriction enzyme R subunit